MAFVRCNCGVTNNQPYYSIRLGHHNTNTPNQLPKLAIDSFKVQVCIRRGLRSNQPRSRPFQTRILLSRSCFELSCHSFFTENTQYLLRRKLSHPNIPRECVDKIVLEAMNFARSLLEVPYHFAFNYNPSPREIPLVIDVVFETPFVEAYERNLRVRIVRNFVEVPMIPAPKKTIEELLKKVKFEDGDETDNCSICFVEFNEDEQVSATPCQHVYHQECIVKWLKTSPMCPLCRHPLSIE